MTRLALFTPHRLARLFVSDARNIGRDPTLVFVTLLSILPLALYAWGGDRLAAWVADRYGFTAIADWLGPVVLVLPAALIGWLTGFLLLEERDDGPLLALDVSPPGKEGFLAYRLIVAMAVSAAISLVAVPVLRPGSGAGTALAMAAMVALETATFAVLLPALARNKVEGLALTKLLNLAAFLPLLAAIPSGWRFAAGWLPGFWLGELGGFFGPPALGAPLTALLGLTLHGAVLALAMRTLARRRG